MTATGELIVPDVTGDTRIMWDRHVPDEVEAAKQQFKALVKDKGYAAYRATGERGDRGEIIRKFDPDAERIILVRPSAGG